MPRDEQYLRDVAQQYVDGLLSLDEAIYILAGNETLTDDQNAMVDQAVADCRDHGSQIMIHASPVRGGQPDEKACAYPHTSSGIVWCYINADGFCIARGIRE
jgi:hypothetical protein